MKTRAGGRLDPLEDEDERPRTQVWPRAGVNSINILRAAVAPIFFYQKITKPNCN